MVEMSRQRTAPACLPVTCSHHFSTPPYLRSRHLKVCATLAREEGFHLAAAWTRLSSPAESDPPLNGEIFITRTFLSLFCLFSIRYRRRPPESSNPFLYPQSRDRPRVPWVPCPHPLEPPCLLSDK